MVKQMQSIRGLVMRMPVRTQNSIDAPIQATLTSREAHRHYEMSTSLEARKREYIADFWWCYRAIVAGDIEPSRPWEHRFRDSERLYTIRGACYDTR